MLIAIDGGSCVGKSTIVGPLVARLSEGGSVVGDQSPEQVADEIARSCKELYFSDSARLL